MWSTAQRQKTSMDLILMLGLNETIDQLANSVHLYGHVMRRGWSCLEKGIENRV